MSSIYRHKINNDPYWFKINLYNAEGKEQSISPTGIKALVLEDCLYNFYHKGYIIIDNRYDAIERSVGENIPELNKENKVPSFVFIGDSRDWINIEIFPLGGNDELASSKVTRHTRIFLQGAIYQVEEIATDTPDVKFKKLYFWDKYYEYLKERNVSWSTADIVENITTKNSGDIDVVANEAMFTESIEAIKNLKVKNVINFSDSMRSVPTGEAIKKFLANALSTDTGYPALFPAQNFDSSSEITTNPNLIADDKNWDLGSSSIFYSTPARYKAIDVLGFLLDRHVSSPDNLYDLAFLRIDRATRCFTFRPLSYFFKNACTDNGATGGPIYIETITLGGYGQSETDDPSYNFISTFTPQQNKFFLQQAGSTVNFAFEPSVGAVTQQEFTTQKVHSYDTEGKEFKIDGEKNSIEEICLTYHKNYVDPIKTQKWASLVPGKTRTLNKNVNHKFSTIEQDEVQRLATGRNKALYTAIFGNNQIKIKLPGSTYRQAGRFVGIDRRGSSPANIYDTKFLGIYLITEVRHIYEGNVYYNELTCIKTYTELEIYTGQIGPNNQNINNQQII